MARKHPAGLALAWVLLHPLAGQCVTAEQTPSLELLEYLAQSQRVEDEWVDPIMVDKWLHPEQANTPSNRQEQHDDDK